MNTFPYRSAPTRLPTRQPLNRRPQQQRQCGSSYGGDRKILPALRSLTSSRRTILFFKREANHSNCIKSYWTSKFDESRVLHVLDQLRAKNHSAQASTHKHRYQFQIVIPSISFDQYVQHSDIPLQLGNMHVQNIRELSKYWRINQKKALILAAITVDVIR